MSDDPVAGDEYGKLIGDTLAEERKRKDSLEGRGLQVLTTSGGLITLLVALSKLAGVDVLTDPPRVMILLSLAAFVGAAVGGLMANQPTTYQEVGVADLQRIASSEEFWSGSRVLGARRSAQVQVDVLAAARLANGRKADLVYVAMKIQVVAIGLLAGGIGWAVLGHRP